LAPNLTRNNNKKVEPIGRNQWAQGVKQKETSGTKNKFILNILDKQDESTTM